MHVDGPVWRAGCKAYLATSGTLPCRWRDWDGRRETAVLVSIYIVLQSAGCCMHKKLGYWGYVRLMLGGSVYAVGSILEQATIFPPKPAKKHEAVGRARAAGAARPPIITGETATVRTAWSRLALLRLVVPDDMDSFSDASLLNTPSACLILSVGSRRTVACRNGSDHSATVPSPVGISTTTMMLPPWRVRVATLTTLRLRLQIWATIAAFSSPNPWVED